MFKPMRLSYLAGVAALALTFSARVTAANPPPGFVSLCNGRDLSGWWGAETEDPRKYMALPPDELQAKMAKSREDINKHWSISGDEVVNDGHGLYLTTDKFYGDFELLLEYKTVPLADSGIYLRGCPQVQIWDYTEQAKFNLGADKGSGGLWNNSPGTPGKDPLVKADKPFGEWNSFRIIMCGSRVWVWLNNQKVVDGANMENYYDRKLPVPPKGPIQLQTHGGEIRWRNIFLREIPSEEANKLVRGTDPEGFKCVFNGKDFDGWTGPVTEYEVRENAIACRPGKGGTIYTKEAYGDFIARLEFKLPAGGNNGLAIRYPGKGDAAYDGMCELQVLDDNYEKVRGPIDPRQAHGSAYGMFAAQRGYQHPINEWNYEEVTVQGSKIKVELNGTTILNCDLSTVKEFMHNSAHPGKDLTRGGFGFAGHSDPVMFRNICIKKLD